MLPDVHELINFRDHLLQAPLYATKDHGDYEFPALVGAEVRTVSAKSDYGDRA